MMRPPSLNLCAACANRRDLLMDDRYYYLGPCDDCGQRHVCGVFREPGHETAKRFMAGLLFGLLVLSGILLLAYRLGAFGP